MTNLSEHPIADIHRGYTEGPASYQCLFCGSAWEQGLIFEVDGHLCDAERAVRSHVDQVHGGAFAALVGLGKQTTGLSDVQRQVVELHHRGLTDRQIAVELGGRSASTVRNHRFQLRRRVREARVFLAVMEHLEARAADPEAFVDFRVPVADERVAVTAAEAEQLLDKYLEDRTTLRRFPKKEKHKLVVLRHLVHRFEPGRRYTEKQVNRVLGEVYPDFATLRRYLVDYRFLARTRDGSAYWRTDSPP